MDDACPTVRVPEDGFTDLDSASPHEPAVDCIVWWGVARGRSATSYAPAVEVTRAQMATFVANAVLRAGGSLPSDAPDRFSDDDDSPHEISIDRLAAAGIVAGRSGDRFAPDERVDRAQMATFLVRAAQHVTGTTLAGGGDWFDDDDGSPHEPSIDTLAWAGLTGGTAGGAYRPADGVRREQMASFLARMLDLLVEDAGASLPT